jgi:hypothetical protein
VTVRSSTSEVVFSSRRTIPRLAKLIGLATALARRRRERLEPVVIALGRLGTPAGATGAADGVDSVVLALKCHLDPEVARASAGLRAKPCRFTAPGSTSRIRLVRAVSGTFHLPPGYHCVATATLDYRSILSGAIAARKPNLVTEATSSAHPLTPNLLGRDPSVLDGQNAAGATVEWQPPMSVLPRFSFVGCSAASMWVASGIADHPSARPAAKCRPCRRGYKCDEGKVVVLPDQDCERSVW